MTCGGGVTGGPNETSHTEFNSTGRRRGLGEEDPRGRMTTVSPRVEISVLVLYPEVEVEGGRRSRVFSD